MGELSVSHGKGIEMIKATKLQNLADSEGVSIDNMLQTATFDSVSPGICINDRCDYTTTIEPDSRDGWCESCQTGSVWSALELGLF